MRRSRYDSYRGGSRGRKALKALLILLLVLLAMAAASFLLLEKYLVYSDDGVRLELPFLQRERPLPTAPALTAPPVLVTPTPGPTPTPAPAGLMAVELPHSALYDGTAQQKLAEYPGADAAVFTMKRPDGTLGYISELELALDCRVSASDPALNGAIRGITAGDLYTVARVCCFQDDAVPYRRSSMGIRSGGGNWRDEDGRRRLNPFSREARDYAAAVCGELAALGFDEILLDCASFPERGRLTTIRVGADYDSDKFTEILDEFYAQVREVLSDYPGVKLSIAASSASLQGRNSALSGQTADLLTDAADRVWVYVDDPADWDGLPPALSGKAILIEGGPVFTGDHDRAVLLPAEN